VILTHQMSVFLTNYDISQLLILKMSQGRNSITEKLHSDQASS